MGFPTKKIRPRPTSSLEATLRACCFAIWSQTLSQEDATQKPSEACLPGYLLTLDPIERLMWKRWMSSVSVPFRGAARRAGEGLISYVPCRSTGVPEDSLYVLCLSYRGVVVS